MSSERERMSSEHERTSSEHERTSSEHERTPSEHERTPSVRERTPLGSVLKGFKDIKNQLHGRKKKRLRASKRTAVQGVCYAVDTPLRETLPENASR